VADRVAARARIAWRLLALGWRSQMQFRGNFVSTLMGGVFLQGTQLLFLGVLLSRFGAIAGWSFDEVAFLFAVRLAAHSLFSVFFSGSMVLELQAYDGTFDRYLLRPANVFVQLLTASPNLMAFGDLLLGVVALSIFAATAPITWTAGSVIFLLIAVVGGGLAEAGIQVFLLGFTFRARRMLSVRIFADNLMTAFAGYPLAIFGRLGLWALTFLYPMAFVAYLPVTVLLGRSVSGLPDWLGWPAPAIGVGLFLGGYAFFMRQIRHYQSPGG